MEHGRGKEDPRDLGGEREGPAGLDRRSFLGALLAAGGVLAGCRAPGADAAGAGGSTDSSLEAWGVQLYTLRDRLAEDIDSTLAAVAAIGFGEVELFQLHGLTPEAMREKLDRVGLRAASSHYPIEALRQGLDEAVDSASILGQRLMVLPSIPADQRTLEGLARVADDLNRAGERAREAGLRVGYHNHDWELRPMADGVLPIDILLDRSDPELVDWQMDIFWTVHGGGDPLAMLRERRGRVTSVHVKDRTPDGTMVDVGAGVIDFAAILEEAEAQGLLHAFVEHDRPGDSVASVRRSYQHLTSLSLDAGARP